MIIWISFFILIVSLFFVFVWWFISLSLYCCSLELLYGINSINDSRFQISPINCKDHSYIQVEKDAAKYQSKFTFDMADIRAGRSGDYTCQLNFAPPMSIEVSVEIMGRSLL